MIEPGLVSVTFRQLCPDEIIELVRQARLGSIAWSGDVHVPLNDPDRARRIGRRTRSAGLEVAGYAPTTVSPVATTSRLYWRRRGSSEPR